MQVHKLHDVEGTDLVCDRSPKVKVKGTKAGTVKTLYNVTRYNRIFNIRHKIAGNRSVIIKIPSL